MKCGVLLLYSASLLSTIGGQVPIVRPGSASSTLRVANGSDVAVQVVCENGTWEGIKSTGVLLQYGSSQWNGRLGAFPATELNFSSLNCTSDGGSSSVTFSRVNTFFFDGLPASTAKLTLLCAGNVPSIPEVNVSVVVNSNYAYCQGDTQRGRFRSRSIQLPDFVTQPQSINITANTTMVSLSCAVAPGSSAQSIQWFYQLSSTDIPQSLTTSSNITIESVIPGASVLILNNQSLRPGLYHCQVLLLNNKTLLNSSVASIIRGDVYSSSPLPSSRMIAYGESTFFSYISENGSSVVCSDDSSLTVNRTNFTTYIIQPPVGKWNITCANNTIILIVTAPLGFSQSLGEYETVVNQGNSVSLQCVVNSSNPEVQVQWIKDLVLVMSGNTLNISNVQRNNSGMYQCVAQLLNNNQSAIVSSTYLNVYFSKNISITSRSGSFVLNRSDPNTLTLQLLCSVDAYPPPNITWKRNGQNWMSGVVQQLVDFTETAKSELSVAASSLAYQETFECRVSQGSLSTSVNITTIASPNITLLVPANITTTEGFRVELSCRATGGQPVPTLTWSASVSVNNLTNVTNETGGAVMNSLTFVATPQQNGVQFVCQAVETGVSQSVLLNVQNNTLSASSLNISTTARNVSFSWPAVVAFPSVTFYQLNVTLLPGGNTTTYTSNTSLVFPVPISLLPFSSYCVTLTPFNSLGSGLSVSKNWTTLEAAPDAAPENLTVSKTEIRSITLSWKPPPKTYQNGIITGYTITWSPVSSGGISSTTASGTNYTIINLTPGTRYQIQVAAKTIAGVSVNTSSINTSTYPAFPTGSKPMSTVNTATTITISLPLPSSIKFSHFWVIVMRLNSTLAQQIKSGNLSFETNGTFVNYSSNVPIGAPYVAAELPGDFSSRVYVLGDETQPNDAPTVHPNKALVPGSMYTAFVWGFFNLTNVISKKRQASPYVRQYTTFSSSEYLAPVTTVAITDTTAGAMAGAIAGGVIGGIVGGVLLVALVVVLVYLLLQKHNTHKGYSLPPRKGSIRLPETSVVKPPRSLPLPFSDIVPENQHQPLIVEQFPNYVKQLHANSDHLFSEEYELFTIKSPNLSHVVSCLPCNVNKNRYANINSFDDTRVCLSLNSGIEGSDYINANYIDGFQRKRAYIATQGPLPSTTYDFWKMVWEQNSCCIIMLTNLVEKTRAKCHQYWPEVGSIILEDLVVTLVESQELAYYSVRTFQMNKGQESYEVKQFHYTGWPDFGVPEMPHPLIAFIRRLENFERMTDGPDIIHCSAGVGRTGTLIAIQELIKMANVERKIDVFNFALGLRKQRSYMIQTEHQYIFIHDAVLEVIKAGNTQTSPQKLREKCNDLSKDHCAVQQEFERVQELQVVKASQFSSAKLPANIAKNRTQSALPYDLQRVRLLMQPGVNGSDYINASYIDGYERKQQYILTQGPLRNTVDDFWRMVWEHKVYTIVMLCCLEEGSNEQCVQYWPTERVKQYGDLFVQLNKESDRGSPVICRELTVTNTKVDESRSLKLYQYTDWEENGSPTDYSDLLGLIATVHKPQQYHNGPIVIHDGISLGRSGSFAVISTSVEQLKAEGVVDIMFTLLTMRQQVPGIVPTVDYYKFCYKVVSAYLNSFQQYSNFD